MERIHIKTSFSLNKYSIVFFLLVGLPSLLLGVEPCTSAYVAKSPSLLSRYSLEAYLPEIGDQGDVGSCVGWASAYYGLTVVKRIEHGRNYPVFSALSAYNRYCFFYDKNPCYGGSQIDGSLEVLKKYGSPLMKDYALQNCAHDPDKTKYKDRLFGYERLQHMNYLQIKAAISNNRPVVIGLNVYAGGKGNSLNTKFLCDLIQSNQYFSSVHTTLVLVGIFQANNFHVCFLQFHQKAFTSFWLSWSHTRNKTFFGVI
jgi:hypothetical protein